MMTDLELLRAREVWRENYRDGSPQRPFSMEPGTLNVWRPSRGVRDGRQLFENDEDVTALVKGTPLVLTHQTVGRSEVLAVYPMPSASRLVAEQQDNGQIYPVLGDRE